MAWHIAGDWIESCTCKMTCPCNLGKCEPDLGWCGVAITFNIKDGKSGNVDLTGCKVAWAVDLPKDFVGGDGTARLYIDEAASTQQRKELDAIFHGKKGGVWETISGVVSKWLPTPYPPLEIKHGKRLIITVGEVGEVFVEQVKAPSGENAILQNPPLLKPFGIDALNICRGNGTTWRDPGMRPWVSGGHGGIVKFNWNA